MHPARGHWHGTLAQALEGRAAGGEDAFRAGIVHRLDRDTSGLLVVAKSDAVHTRAEGGAARRDIIREYLALVEGRPPARSGTIDAPIGRDRRVRTRHSTDTDDGARGRARTSRSSARSRRPRCCASACRPAAPTRSASTSRRSATRSAATPSTARPGLYGLERQFLHAEHLAFTHPVTGEPVDVHSPLPDDLAAALERAAG